MDSASFFSQFAPGPTGCEGRNPGELPSFGRPASGDEGREAVVSGPKRTGAGGARSPRDQVRAASAPGAAHALTREAIEAAIPPAA